MLPLENVLIEGNELKLDYAVQRNNSTTQVQMTAIINGNILDGTQSFAFRNQTMERSWLAIRQPADLNGNWTIEILRDNGEVWNSTLKLKASKSGKLTGSIETPNMSMSIQNGQISGNAFSYETSNPEGTWVALTKGRLDGDQLKGTVTFEFDGRQMERSWKADKN